MVSMPSRAEQGEGGRPGQVRQWRWRQTSWARADLPCAGRPGPEYNLIFYKHAPYAKL